MSGPRRGRRSRATKHGELLTFDEGDVGPDWFDEPLPEFPTEAKSEFQREGHALRMDGVPQGIWPKCEHGLDCVVQVLHINGGVGSGRRFFRCPLGMSYGDDENCKWTHWVDPPVNGMLEEYIAHLHNKIFDLMRELEEPSLSDSIQTISINNDDVAVFCRNLHCTCPHHKPGPAEPPPPPPGAAQGPPPPPPPQPPYGYDNNYYSQGSSNYM